MESGQLKGHRLYVYGFDKELATKPGVNLVEPKEKFKKEYTIKIG